MKNTLIFILCFLPFSVVAIADEAPCEVSLVKFLVNGVEVPSKVIGLTKQCDDFGGNLAFSPKHHIYTYVNFNIEAEIPLDELDLAYEKAITTCFEGHELKAIDLAVVKADWISKVYNSDKQAILSWNRRTLFISEKVFKGEGFIPLMNRYYDAINSVCPKSRDN